MSARTDERIQPALHALLVGDVDGLCAALEVDPEVVNLTVGGNTLLELTTQPDVSPPSSEVVDALVEAGAAVDRALNLAGCWNLPDLCAQLLASAPTRRPAPTRASHRWSRRPCTAPPKPLTSSPEPACTDQICGSLPPPACSRWYGTGSTSTARCAPTHGAYRPNWADVGRPAGAAPSDDPREILG